MMMEILISFVGGALVGFSIKGSGSPLFLGIMGVALCWAGGYFTGLS